MGFMGLNHWVESDMAADFRAGLIHDLLKATRKELKNKANEYNTPGYMNIALLIEDNMYDGLSSDDVTENFDIFKSVIDSLEQALNDWESCHDDIKRLKVSVMKFLSKKVDVKELTK